MEAQRTHEQNHLHAGLLDQHSAALSPGQFRRLLALIASSGCPGKYIEAKTKNWLDGHPTFMAF